MKSTTLKENKDFRRAYYRGKSEAGSALVTYAVKSRLPYSRVGITSGKKIGNAVKRNRARRLIRAAFSQYEDRLGGSFDIVFVARTHTTEVKMQTVAAQMEAQLKKLGMLD
ncbi:MAG: ribonuclease P protein component [Eubacterium sp.]|nr:ribonuclease P protein component [Eubacterium sp.]